MQHVVIHQHCYQPPREDPWLEVVPQEPSAAPDHDWNSRINRECYARLGAAEAHRRDRRAAARDPDARAGLARIVNLFGWCSFDVGATLCEWLDAQAPDTLAAMQAGDAAGVRRWGHGNAIAAPYHHVILPLASPRDRRTEIRWGIADFRQRFGRDPEGMWLPECAVDEDTLDLVAQEGIQFTILAPYQVHGHHGNGMPVRWRGASGRSLAIVPYDGSLAGEVAFGGLLRDAPTLARRLAPVHHGHSDESPRCTTLATDGETFGHHHKAGESTLTEALSMAAQQPGTRVLNAAALVAMYPPTTDVSLVSPSAWSCAHGVERWRSNCGCRLDGSKHPAQQWRGPLRHALERLAGQVNDTFVREGTSLFRDDPWHARDAYGAVVARDGDVLHQHVRTLVREGANDGEQQRARELLEMQRASLRTFTSCAWFFDEVDRIEVRQVLRYAARAIELTGSAARLTPDFVQWLTPATSGAPDAGSASELFVREALPYRDAVDRVAAAAMACAAAGTRKTRITTFDVHVRDDGGTFTASVQQRRTGKESIRVGTVHGSGPQLVVKLAGEQAEPGAEKELTIHEFPEEIARELLLPTSLSDHALFVAP